MRIAAVSHDPVTPGAHSVRVRALVRVLASRGHEVALLTATEVPPEDALATWCREIVALPQRPGRSRVARLLRRLVTLPDPMAQWARALATDPQVLGLSGRVDVLFLSSPPHGMQVAGPLLAEAWGVPYVADLRDDWVGNHRYRWKSPVHKGVARRLERRMVREAALILANSPRMRDQLLSRHPGAEERVVVLTNGFNESEFNGPAAKPHAGDRIRVGYFGSDYAGHVPRFLAEMARQWRADGQEARWQIVAHVGAGAASAGPEPPLLNLLPYLPPAESARAMSGCDVLLLLMPPGEREPSPTVPLKSYSYLRTGLPIVYCGERGATTDLLGEFAGTYSLPRCSGAELAKFMTVRRDEWAKRYPRQGIARYSFESLGTELDRLLCEVVERGRF